MAKIDDKKTKEVKKVKETKKEIVLKGLNISEITIDIIGTSPLLMDKLPKEVADSILAKQAGISNTNSKKIRDTKQEVLNAIHYTSSGKIGFPVEGFKRGMMDSAVRMGSMKFTKSLVAGAIRITNSEDGLIPIKYKKQVTFERMIGHNTKFSPMFQDWSCQLVIKFDANNISATDIVTLINYSGFYVGIGAWRKKSKDGGSGEFGCYEVLIGKK